MRTLFDWLAKLLEAINTFISGRCKGKTTASDDKLRPKKIVVIGGGFAGVEFIKTIPRDRF